MFQKSFGKSQFPHKFVNSFFILVIIKDKLTDLWGNWLLQNNCIHTLYEIRTLKDVKSARGKESQHVKPKSGQTGSSVCSPSTQGRIVPCRRHPGRERERVRGLRRESVCVRERV